MNRDECIRLIGEVYYESCKPASLSDEFCRFRVEN